MFLQFYWFLFVQMHLHLCLSFSFLHSLSPAPVPPPGPPSSVCAILAPPPVGLLASLSRSPARAVDSKLQLSASAFVLCRLPRFFVISVFLKRFKKEKKKKEIEFTAAGFFLSPCVTK